MPRWLPGIICVLAFAAPIGAACLHAWPFVTSRPLPAVLDTEAALLTAGEEAVMSGRGTAFVGSPGIF